MSSEGTHYNGSLDVGDKTTLRKGYQYSSADDLSILREILKILPFGGKSGFKWTTIHENLRIAVKDGTAIKNRFILLLKNFNAGNTKSLRGSGGQAEYTEKMQLLGEINSIKDTMEREKKELNETKKEMEDNDQAAAKIIEDVALNTVVKSCMETKDSHETPKRAKKEDILNLKKISDKRDIALKERQIDVELRKLDYQEKQLELQQKEFDLRRENDVHRREIEKARLKMEQDEKSLLLKLLISKCVN